MSPDHGLLADMLREARVAIAFVDGMSVDDFLADQRTQYAVVRCLEIIGEAASRVSEAGRAQLPSIPWSQVIGQRHLAIHHYAKLSMPRVWITVREYVPSLAAVLESYLERIP